MEVHIWHVALGMIAAALGPLGIISTLWTRHITPAKREREELIRWRASQEEKDRQHDADIKRLRSDMDDRLGRGSREFAEIKSDLLSFKNEVRGKFDEMTKALHRLEVSLAEHRRSCEGKP